MIKNRSALVTTFLTFSLVTTPLFAAGAKQGSFFQDLVSNILTPLLGLVSMGAFVYFLFGIARYFIDKDQNEDARAKLKTHLTWGLVGLFIIFSIGGIMTFVSSFGGGLK